MTEEQELVRTLDELAAAGTLVIGVTDYGDGRECAGAAILHELYDGGALPNFAAVSPPHARGNCRSATAALMLDLIIAGKAAGWFWAEGRTLRLAGPEKMRHSWLEHESWAFEVSNGRIIACDVWEHRRERKARVDKLRDAAATKQWIQRKARSLAMTEPEGRTP